MRRKGRWPACPAEALRAICPRTPTKHWSGKVGVDARWEHNLVVVDSSGKISEDWTKWERLFQAAACRIHQSVRRRENVWSSTTTNTPSSSSATTGKISCKPSARPTKPARTTSILIGPRFSPAARRHHVRRGRIQRQRASRSSTKTEIPPWPWEKKAFRQPRWGAPVTSNVVHGIAADPCHPAGVCG